MSSTDKISAQSRTQPRPRSNQLTGFDKSPGTAIEPTDLSPASTPHAGSDLLSFAQERLWFLWRLEPDVAAYNRPTLLRLSGALNYAAFERAFNEVTRRHEILRADDFFFLGGDSLAMTRVVARIRKAFGVEISVAECYMASTLEEQAALVRTGSKAVAGFSGRGTSLPKM